MLTEIEIAQLRAIVPEGISIISTINFPYVGIYNATLSPEVIFTSFDDVYNYIRRIFSIKDEAILYEPNEIAIMHSHGRYRVIFVELVLTALIHKSHSFDDMTVSERYVLIEQMYIIYLRFKKVGLTVYFNKFIKKNKNWIIVISRCDIIIQDDVITTIWKLNSYPKYNSQAITNAFNEVAIYDSMNPIYNCLLWQKLHPLFAAVKTKQTRLTYDALWLIGTLYIPLNTRAKALIFTAKVLIFTTMWPIEVDIHFMHIRMRILQKKAMMHTVIKDLRTADRILRGTIMTLALTASILSVAVQSTIIPESLRQIMSISNFLVVVLIRVSEYLRLHRNRDAAKLQYVKYDLLSQKIADEINKPDSIRLSYERFIVEIENEYRTLTIADPILSKKQTTLYKKECSALGVVILTDSEELIEAQRRLTERSREIRV